ncbi:MAG: LD-carboxypeptidase [Bacteroidales bacterium]|jgi:muramoyltetrapeptide carboxypeptidase|nr:LD-carboxypeptidase [Bacteroidales bacterium]
MLTPPFLKAGDTIGIIAPGYKIATQQWEQAVPLLESWGLQVKSGKSLRLKEQVFAGTDAQRFDDLSDMMQNHDIKAILCARGGYGSVRLLPYFEEYIAVPEPKWLIGYSDITVLLTYFTDQLQWKSIHGPMPVDLSEGLSEEQVQSWEYLRRFLFGQTVSYELSPSLYNREGEVKALVTGGNLSVLYGLIATPFQCLTDGKILFIEEVNESLHHIDRMMMNMKLSGQLSRLKGLIIGSMSEMKDTTPSFGKTAQEIIYEHVKEYDYPVMFNFPAGHGGVNYPLVMGADLQLKITKDLVLISFM